MAIRHATKRTVIAVLSLSILVGCKSLDERVDGIGERLKEAENTIKRLQQERTEQERQFNEFKGGYNSITDFNAKEVSKKMSGADFDTHFNKISLTCSNLQAKMTAKEADIHDLKKKTETLENQGNELRENLAKRPDMQGVQEAIQQNRAEYEAGITALRGEVRQAIYRVGRALDSASEDLAKEK